MNGSWHRRRGGDAGPTAAQHRRADVRPGSGRRLAGCLLLWAGACGAADIAWQNPLEVARGAGERGAWQQNASRYDFVDDPSVAYSRRGELAVAWVDQHRKAVLVQRYAAGDPRPLGPPVEVARTPHTFSWLPRLAWAPDDDRRLHVLWQEIVFSGGSHGGEIVTSVSHDGGRSFAAPVNLSNSRAGDGKGRLTADVWHNGSYAVAAAPGGRVYASWTEYDGRLWFVRSGDGGRSYAVPRLLAGEPPAPPARAPALAVGPDGTVVLAWTTGDDPAADIQVAVSTDGGRHFSPPRAAAVTGGHSDAPKLAFDARGALHLVHTESQGGPFGRGAVRHLRSTDGGRSFGPATVISNPLPAGYAGAAYPSIGTDRQGRVVVVWELLRGPATAPYGLAIAVAADGLRFDVPAPIPGSIDPGGGFNGSTQGLLLNKLALRGDGALVVANSALKPGSHSRVWLLRGSVR